MSSTTVERSEATIADGFMAVPMAVFDWLEQTGVDLFVDDGAGGNLLLLRGNNLEVSAERLAQIKSDGNRQLYVRNNDFDRAGRRLRKRLDGLLADANVAPEECLSLLQMAMAFEIETCFRLVKCDRYLALAQRLGTLIAHLVSDQPIVPSKLFHLLRHDEPTFTHVTNVACYVVLLARELGIGEESEIEQIAAGGLLHDVGKRVIPPEILNKKGLFTRTEREVVERHPRQGYVDLLEAKELVEAQRLMAYQHHERMDGRGYPVRILGDEIHPWSKMLSVVDVFDALTGDRPYRPPVRPAEALEYLQKNAGTHFDKEMVTCWVQLMTR